jgi:hypothetical protein
MKRQFVLVLGAAILSQGLTACGRAPYAKSTSSAVTFNFNPSSPSSSSSSTSSGTAPVYELPVEMIGYNPATVDVQTNTRLRIRVRADQSGGTIQGSNYPAIYSQMYVRVSLTAINRGPLNYPKASVMTPVLNNGLQAAQQWTQIYNFDQQWGTVNCTLSNSACREGVRITVDQPNTDFFWTNGIFFYQPTYNGPSAPTPQYAHAQNGHRTNVTLFVETVDTVALPQ